MDDITRKRIERGLLPAPRAQLPLTSAGDAARELLENTPPEVLEQVAQAKEFQAEMRRLARPTHQLEYRGPGQVSWTVQERGSSAAMEDSAGRLRRHYPRFEFRVVERQRPRKAWSVKDPDHLRNGARVMLRLTPEELRPDIAGVREALGLPLITERLGEIVYRYFQSGDYVVRLDGGQLAITLSRDDLIHPVPDGVVSIDPARRQR